MYINADVKKEMLGLLLLNTASSVALTYVLSYVYQCLYSESRTQQEHIEYLCLKICNMEREMLQLKVQLDDVTSSTQKDENVIAKIEEFITSTYEVVEK